jgi:hypothetical protein
MVSSISNSSEVTTDPNFLDKICILKGCIDLPQLYFGTLFSRAMNLDTPDCRVIEYNDPEFNEIFLNLERCAIGDPVISNKINYDIKDRPFLILFEYVPSLTLFNFGINRSQLLFRKSNPNSRKLFIQIGKILAIDMFLNNHDRLPWLWDNPGNANNILFKINLDLIPPGCDFKDHKYLDIILESVVMIDTKPICLNPEDKFQLKHLAEYINTLSEVLREFFYEMKNVMIYGKDVDAFEFKCFNTILDFFNNSTGYILEGMNLFHVSLGFLIMLNDLLKLDLSDIEKLIQFVQNRVIIKDWADVFKSNAKLLNINYFKYILSFLHQLRDENEEIFKFVEECTADYYGVDFRGNLNKVLNEQQLMKFGTLHYDYIKDVVVENVKIEGEYIEIKPPVQLIPDNRETVYDEKGNPLNDPVKRYDHFNFLETDVDKFKFMNDVHNGLYDVMPLDSDMIFEVKAREFNKAPVSDGGEMKFVTDNSLVKRSGTNLQQDDPYKKYTMDELKDKIKEDELKDTFKLKRKFNPDEAKYLEDKIGAVDQNFLRSNSILNNDGQSFTFAEKKKIPLDVKGLNSIPESVSSTNLLNQSVKK